MWPLNRLPRIVKQLKDNLKNGDANVKLEACIMLQKEMLHNGPLFQSLIIQHILPLLVKMATKALESVESSVQSSVDTVCKKAIGLVMCWGNNDFPNVEILRQAAAKLEKRFGMEKISCNMESFCDNTVDKKSENNDDDVNSRKNKEGTVLDKMTALEQICREFEHIVRCGGNCVRLEPIMNSFARLLVGEQESISKEISESFGVLDSGKLDRMLALNDSIANVLKLWKSLDTQTEWRFERFENYKCSSKSDVNAFKVAVFSVRVVLHYSDVAALIGGILSADVVDTIRRIDNGQLGLMRTIWELIKESKNVNEELELSREAGDVLLAWQLIPEAASELVLFSQLNSASSYEFPIAVGEHEAVLVESGVFEVLEAWEVSRREPIIPSKNSSSNNNNNNDETDASYASEVVLVSKSELCLDENNDNDNSSGINLNSNDDNNQDPWVILNSDKSVLTE